MKVIHYIGINSAIRSAGILSAVLLFILSSLTIIPLVHHTDSTEAATGTAQESTLSLDITNATASVDLTVASTNGTFASSSVSNEASFSVTTNNYTGYTLSISASDNSGTLVNGSDSLASISSSLTASQFDVSANNGKWGYKPNKYRSGNITIDNTGNNAVFLTSPTTEATTLDITNAPNANANTYSIALGARADYTKPNGNYSKTFVITAVANRINYSVTYNANAGTDTVTNMPYSSTSNTQSGDTNGTTITLSNLVPVRDGYIFKGWCSASTGDDTCSGTTYNPDGAGSGLTYGIDQTTVNIANLYAMWQSAETQCDDTKLCVQYEGNGLTYDGKTVNRVNYDSTTTQSQVTKILHSDNVGDDGIATGNSATNTDQTKEATIDGASSVNVILYYDTEGISYDWVTLYAGADSVPSSSNDGTIGSNGNLTGKLGGNKSGYTTSYTTWNLWNNSGNPINSDTIKIHFATDDYADDGYISYGYYAIITGTGTVFERTVASGNYSTPTGSNTIFHGWSSTQTTAGGGLPSQVEYADESEVKSKMPGDEGEAKTLYAVWQQGQRITFTKDSNVSSIAVLNSDGTTAGTVTTSGQSLVLVQGNTYTIIPTHTTGYDTNAITKTTGLGTLSGKEFTVEAGSATISVTSKLFCEGVTKMQQLTSSNIATLLPNTGSTTTACDIRDGEEYTIAKLADGKYWLLDNLRLDLTDSTVLANTIADNTNASATALNYLKNGGGTTSDQWPTAKINNVAWTSSSQHYYSIPMVVSSGNCDNTTYCVNDPSSGTWNKDATATVSYGSGSGKIGVYYNYCAASAGTYCWGNGTGYAGTPESDPKTDTGYDIDGDICPAGWRMPTGGAIATGTIAKGEYQSLANAITGGTSSSLSGDNATAFKTALSTPLSGSFYVGLAFNQGSYGYFWSSTYNDSIHMYSPSVGSSNVSPQNYFFRIYGYPVRCVLK